MLRVFGGLPPMPGRRGHVRECAVAVVVVQGVPPDAAQEEIFVAVVVVIADRHAEVEIQLFSREPRLRGHVFESSVALLMQQAVEIGSVRLLQLRQFGAVGEEDVDPCRRCRNRMPRRRRTSAAGKYFRPAKLLLVL